MSLSTAGGDDVRIEHVDPRTLRDSDAHGIWEVDVACDRAAGLPEILITPLAVVAAEIRHQPDDSVLELFLARDPADRIVGYAWTHWRDVPSNRGRAQVDARVLPDARRSGVGSTLARRAVAAARGLRCTSIIANARVGGPGDAFLGRCGLSRRQVEPVNVMWTNSADRSLLSAWVGAASERASDYRMVMWDGPVPEPWLDEYVDLWHVMNTAPTDDLEWDDEVLTPTHLRAQEQSEKARSIEIWVVAALHEPTGRLAGFTELKLLRDWPTVAIQGDTGVRVDHRERGLGRWLKASNALRLLDERPAVSAVLTWNAASNDSMLSINHAMGFAPVEYWADWQADIDTVEASLA